MVQDWIVSATAGSEAGVQAPGAGSRGDVEIGRYESFEAIGGSVRDWIDYTLGWKGEKRRHE